MAPAMIKSHNGIDILFDNPPVLSPPKDAPPRYQWKRALEYSDFADWAAVSRHYEPLFSKAAALAANSPLRLEASRIAAAQARPLDRASAALRLVQQDVRYIYVGLNGGNLIPASADATWRQRYGDCKGKTALLLALLAQLGIPAEPVLVNSTGTDDGLDQRLPSPQFFDHVLVRAHIDGKPLWLDGTLPPVASPGARPAFPVRWVLPLTEHGAALEELAWVPPTVPDEVHLFEIDARAGFDKPARIVSTEIIRGVDGLKSDLQLSSVSKDQLLDIYRQRAIGDTWQSIDEVDWRYDVKAQASILKVAGTGTVSWEEDGDGAKSLALPGGGFSPPDRRVRVADQSSMNAPFYTKPEYTCHVTTVRLSETTTAQQWSSKAGYDTRLFGRAYHRAWELRDGAIRMVRGSRVEQPEIDATTAQRDNDRSMGYIFFTPAGQKTDVGRGEKVPTTYDFDWTSSEVPCIGSAAAGGK